MRAAVCVVATTLAVGVRVYLVPGQPSLLGSFPTHRCNGLTNDMWRFEHSMMFHVSGAQERDEIKESLRQHSIDHVSMWSPQDDSTLFGVVNFAGTETESLLSVQATVSIRCDAMGQARCDSWAFLLSSMTTQKDAWFHYAIVSSGTALCYTYAVLRRNIAAANLFFLLSICVLVSSVALTSTAYTLLGYKDTMITDAVNVMIVGAGMDSILISLSDEYDRQTSLEVTRSTVLASVTTVTAFVMLWLWCDIGDVKGMYVKGAIGFALCTVVRIAMFGQVLSPYDAVRVERVEPDRRDATRPTAARVSVVALLALLALAGATLFLDPIEIRRSFSYHDAGVKGSKEFRFHKRTSAYTLDMPFVVLRNGSRDDPPDLAALLAASHMDHRVSCRQATCMRSLPYEAMDVWTSPGNMVVTNELIAFVHALDAALPERACITCAVCSMVDMFDLMDAMSTRIVAFLCVSLCAYAHSFGRLRRALLLSLLLVLTVRATRVAVQLLFGHVTLTDHLVIALLPGLAVDYTIHIMFCGNAAYERHVLLSVFHCYVTSALSSCGLIASPFPAISSVGTSFVTGISCALAAAFALHAIIVSARGAGVHI